MRPQAPILGSLSWLPYGVFCKIREESHRRLKVDLSEYGVDKSFWLTFPPEDGGLSMQLSTFGFREPLNCQCYVDFVDKDDTLLDIGSNIGFFALLGSNAKKITCVEPLSGAIPFLKSNIQDNHLQDKTEIINAAVGPKGKLLLEINDHLNLSKIVSKKNGHTVEVPSIPLEELVEKYPSNLLRMDVEGYEYDILYNHIPNTVTKVSMEFHTGLMGQKKSQKLLDYFEEEGFKATYFVEDVPLRCYPLVRILKNPRLLKFVSYVQKNLRLDEVQEKVFSGRSLKYLYLER